MINIAGVSDGRIAQIISESYDKNKGQYLVVVPTLNRAKRLRTDLSFFGADNVADVFFIPPDDESIGAYEAKSNESLMERIHTLRAVTSGKPCIVIAPATGAIKKLPPSEIFKDNTFKVEIGSDIDLSEFRERLALLGYERVSMIEARGEYSIRGGIIDIYTPDGELPYRIELFDTEVDSIRSFDLETQRSCETLKDITLYQCSQIPRDEEVFAEASGRIERAYNRQIKKLPELAEQLTHRKNQLLEYTDSKINLQYMEKFLHYFYDKTEYVWDYMKDPVLMIDDPTRILEGIESIKKEREYDIEEIISSGRGIKEDFAMISDERDFFKLYDLPEERGLEGYIFTPFVMTIKGPHGAADGPKLKELRQLETRQTPQYNGNMDLFRADLESYIARGYDITIVSGTEERKNNMLEFIEHEGFNKRILPGRHQAGHIEIVQGTITAGLEFADEKRCYIWDEDIFGGNAQIRRSKRRANRKSTDAGTNAKKIKSFADLTTGDYVVHEAHGIGKFIGIEQLIVQDMRKDFLKVKYAGADILYIPVDQLNQLQKYIGGDGVSPKVNKLSGSEWKATKAKAMAAVSDMAAELLRVANVRRNKEGFAFSEDTVWQKEFEDSFRHTETEDQLQCVEEIKADMEKSHPMDRLLCGDVGFGKTEVAARALFKCVIEGKQAAILVPTTLLANQHFYTLKERFEKFPIRVEMLSRFKTQTQQKKIVKDIVKGEIDLIIGTHRLLSKDISFKDLGLLVVDEEQRFGVRHKEKMKQLRENIDVLTLSATPIPRTLHMSLSGMKDMSTIEEPPEDRYPVQTYVMEEDDFLIRELIEKEIARGGQVYVLYNKVKTINALASKLRDLLPGASVVVGHGQMGESELEDVIMDFAGGEYDVLVSTTIIESGMDIPNVNTMIVLDSDKFGLSQLYQLRGRVGRSGRIAYAYLMYKRDKVLSEIAEKRLKAIRDFTEFGSGFKIAMRDLELRGAGNLLGREQSGHMLEIGYELYCKLLEDALQAESRRIELGEEHDDETGSVTLTQRKRNIDLAPEREATAINLAIPAIIPSRYIDDEMLKLQMYKKIAFVECREDAEDLLDEFIDRFGDPPRETQNLIRIAVLKSCAERLGVTEISQSGYKLKFTLEKDVRFGADTIPDLVEAYGEKIRFNGGKNPHIILTVGIAPKTAGKQASPNYVTGILKEMEQFFNIV